jgi:hypothetical protein
MMPNIEYKVDSKILKFDELMIIENSNYVTYIISPIV